MGNVMIDRELFVRLLEFCVSVDFHCRIGDCVLPRSDEMLAKYCAAALEEKAEKIALHDSYTEHVKEFFERNKHL